MQAQGGEFPLCTACHIAASFASWCCLRRVPGTVFMLYICYHERCITVSTLERQEGLHNKQVFPGQMYNLCMMVAMSDIVKPVQVFDQSCEELAGSDRHVILFTLPFCPCPAAHSMLICSR